MNNEEFTTMTMLRDKLELLKDEENFDIYLEFGEDYE